MTNFSELHCQQTPEEMLTTLRNEMTFIKAEEASLKKQILSLNDQFQELMISVAELYPDILSEEFAKQPANFDSLSKTTKTSRPDNLSPGEIPFPNISYRYTDALRTLGDTKEPTGPPKMKRRTFAGEAPKINSDGTSTSPTTSNYELLLRKRTMASNSLERRMNDKRNNSKDAERDKNDQKEQVRGVTLGKEDKDCEAQFGEPFDSLQLGEIEKESVGVESPGASSNGSSQGRLDTFDSERRKRIKQKLKESRKQSDVVHLGLF